MLLFYNTFKNISIYTAFHECFWPECCVVFVFKLSCPQIKYGIKVKWNNNPIDDLLIP